MKPLRKRTAVVLLNLGGPSTQEEIKPFLFSLFYDPAILTLPNPFRYVLAHLITRRRLKEAKHIYSLLGGGSPLLKNTKAQASALELELGQGYRVFIAMRHAPPLTGATAKEVRAYDPGEIVLLPLFPQYSTTTTESSFKAWNTVAKDWKIQTRFIKDYPKNDGFLEAMKLLIMSSYKEAQGYGPPKVLLTAHGLPEKTIRKGDPYQSQIEETADALIEKLGFLSLDSVVCYQSQVGPLKWIGPSLKQEILSAAQKKRPLIVVPISFVSEHSETLVELDRTYRSLALAEGCPAYLRVNTVQTHPLFIKGLASLVKEERGLKTC